MENPYQPSVSTEDSMSEVTGILSGSREDLRRVAQYQKGIISCILLQFLFYLIFVLGAALGPYGGLGSLIALLGLLAAGIAGAVFVFMLAIKVYGIGLGIAFAIGSFFPCLGLILLLVINGKATSILQQNGIKVGFLGANPAAI
jgi:hypothetical protein